MKFADCHPDRVHCAKGLCQSCYVTARKKARRPNRTTEEIEKERAYNREYRRDWRAKNRERDRKYSREWQRKKREEDPVGWNEWRTAMRYKLSVNEYRDLVSRGICDACGRSPENKLQVDHCHTTGEIRGILCSDCNTALGRVDDDPGRLKALIRYLGRAQTA